MEEVETRDVVGIEVRARMGQSVRSKLDVFVLVLGCRMAKMFFVYFAHLLEVLVEIVVIPFEIYVTATAALAQFQFRTRTAEIEDSEMRQRLGILVLE